MSKIFRLFITFIFLSSTLIAQSVKNGSWKGTIHYESVKVPFTFEYNTTSDTSAVVVIKNAEEEIVIKNVVVKNDSIIIPMYVFDATILAVYKEEIMTGEWHKNYKNNKGPRFTAEYNKPRFSINAAKKIDIAPTWDITFMQPNGQSSKAVGLFKQLNKGGVSATIMTEVGDFRYFDGVLYGDSICLSSFDGVHGFLMLGTYINNKWSGVFHYEDGYSEKWSATYDAKAQLTSPFTLITTEPETHKPYYDILTAGGEYNAIEPEMLDGKVVIIQLMGTWCPNSLDQTKYLTNWYQSQNKDKLVLMAVTYEPGDKNYAQKRIDSYSKLLDIPYQMYIGGSLSKGQAALAFPNMGIINAFPSLILIDKNGYIRFIDSYFNGPATGKHYQEFDEVFNKRVNELLSE